MSRQRHFYMTDEWYALLEDVAGKIALERKRRVTASEAVRVAVGRLAKHYGIRPPADIRPRMKRRAV